MIEEIKQSLKDEKKKKKIIIGIVLVLLLFSNPTITDFKTFIGETSEGSYYSKNVNLFLCSFYTWEDRHYIGIAKNFIPISRASY